MSDLHKIPNDATMLEAISSLGAGKSVKTLRDEAASRSGGVLNQLVGARASFQHRARDAAAIAQEATRR